jgi:hypothetical protein
MNHNQTLMNLKFGACSFGLFFFCGLSREHVPARKVLRSLLQVDGVFCSRAECLKKNPREIEI